MNVYRLVIEINGYTANYSAMQDAGSYQELALSGRDYLCQY